MLYRDEGVAPILFINAETSCANASGYSKLVLRANQGINWVLYRAEGVTPILFINAETSCANASGCSKAVKWPPRGIS